MPVAAYYLHDPAAPRPNSPTRMGTNVLLECRGRLLLEQRWDCGAWGLPGGRLRRGEDEAHGIARELFEETGLRLPEAAFTRVRVVDDADRIASYQDGTVWRMVIVLFRAQLPQEPELHCSRESCTLRFFTPEELGLFAQWGATEDAFFTLWARKEALGKLSGRGLRPGATEQGVIVLEKSFQNCKICVMSSP